MGYIYKLIDPLSNKIRYIGKTNTSLETRLKRHITQSRSSNTHVKCWIRYLLSKNTKPIIELIERCDESELNNREIYWINYYSKFTNLCNISKGGEGATRGKDHALKIKAKITKALELIDSGYTLKKAEEMVGLTDGFFSVARRGKLQYIIDNNIVIPNLTRKGNHKNKVLNTKTNEVFTSQKEAAEKLGLSLSTVYITIKNKGYLQKI